MLYRICSVVSREETSPKGEGSIRRYFCGEAAAAEAPTAAGLPACEHRTRHRPRSPPRRRARLGARSGHGSSRELAGARLQPPPRARVPSGLHLLLLALLPPPPLPEKAPRKPPHFPSQLRTRASARPFGRARPLKGEWPALSTSRAPRAGGRGYGGSRGSTPAPRGTCWRGAGRVPTCRSTRGLRGSPSPPLEGGARIHRGRASSALRTGAPATLPRLAPGPPARSPSRSPQPSFSFLEDTWEASVP